MNDTVIIFCAFSFVCRAYLWADILGLLYSARTIKIISCKAVCNQYFSRADWYISPDCICLNRIVVPILCATSTQSHSAPKLTELTFPIPPISSLSPTVACTDYLPVQKQIKTHSKLCTMTSKLFTNTEPSIAFGCYENVCGGELGSVSLQISSP